MDQFELKIGANAPPGRGQDIQPPVINLAVGQPSFLDVFSFELDKNSSMPLSNEADSELWKPKYFEDYNSWAAQNQYSSQMDASNKQSEYVQQVSSDQEQLSSQTNQYSENSSVADRSSVQQEKTPHQDHPQKTDVEKVPSKTESRNSEPPKQTHHEAQEIAKKSEDLQKAVLEAAQASVSNLNQDQQIDLLAKVFAMMAPQAGAGHTEAKIESSAGENQKVESNKFNWYKTLMDAGEGDLKSMVKDILDGKTLSDKLVNGKEHHENSFVNLLKNKENNAASTAHINVKVDASKMDDMTEKLPAIDIHQNQNQNQNQVDGTTKPHIDLLNKAQSANQDGIITPQKSDAKDVKINSKDGVQSQKVNVEVKNHQPLNFSAEKTTQVAGTSKTFELARSAETRETTPIIQISKNIEVMIKEGKSSMKVQLYPESLGKIELQIVHTSDGVSVAMLPNQSATVKLLESQLDQLRTALSNAGIQLSDLNVSQQQTNAQEQDYKQSSRHNSGRLFFDDLEHEEIEPAQILQLDSLSAMDYRV